MQLGEDGNGNMWQPSVKDNMQHKSKAVNINVGDVVMIKDESKKSGKWKISIISKLFQGKDDQIRGAQVKTPRGYLDRPIQLLYPLELHCNRYKIKQKQHESDKKKLNVEAKEFRPKITKFHVIFLDFFVGTEHNFRQCNRMHAFKDHVKIVKIYMVKFNASILNRLKTIFFFS